MDKENNEFLEREVMEAHCTGTVLDFFVHQLSFALSGEEQYVVEVSEHACVFTWLHGLQSCLFRHRFF